MPSEGTPPEIEVGGREFDAEGLRWRVSVEGRAAIRAGGGTPTPVLLLLFRPTDSGAAADAADAADAAGPAPATADPAAAAAADPDASRVLEGFVVGRTLEEKSDDELRETLRDARPHGPEARAARARDG